MSAVLHAHPESGPALGISETGKTRRVLSEAGMRGRWWRFVLILAITVIVLVPIMVTVVLAFTPGPNSTATGFTFENLANVFNGTLAATWLQNSLVTTLSTVVVSVAVAAPAGYVLSRGRSKAVSGYSLLLSCSPYRSSPRWFRCSSSSQGWDWWTTCWASPSSTSVPP